ncbi:hypothetical protein LX15_006188 [Streptoalloteichus tenebrarius]|uniref:YtxH domain-containing protein n=1 Tax=Streptoalloteichus tenebrarius (strain ATCC 17920 / DSM 40477 / JCM 4838 / CBS 697.72 / NBRC 16177 / NCIMB 11028 / NRRL B-12390 / A12253. 1 / ISP 5477) TaxID=1933 RepID=A0ABT1I3Z5_STRSD|nr:hypothetical protein [Streptoalloteichus tenebrarius]MCP2262451.1 hypothetical protein [Streptoalloteichus tenebrarius]BFF00427.1 hypothetical protein GCM10020241_21020 [Streptoalloteichus tenebrarius]
MKGFLLGVAAGYVLGARAGRERYEQIVSTYRRFVDHPTVQGLAGIVRAKVSEITTGRHPGAAPRRQPPTPRSAQNPPVEHLTGVDRP